MVYVPVRWYGLVSLISDGRVKFLIGFVIVAIIVAGILTLIEIKLKKKKDEQVVETENRSLEYRLDEYMESNNSVREKLNFINKIAKDHFKESYGTSLKASYSFLIEYFEKNKRREDVVFCKAMFAAYYSSNDLTEERVVMLAGLLRGLLIKKLRDREISQVPSFLEKFDRYFVERSNNHVKQREIKAKKKKSKRLRKKRIAERKNNFKVVDGGGKQEVKMLEMQNNIALKEREGSSVERVDRVNQDYFANKKPKLMAEYSNEMIIQKKAQALLRQEKKRLKATQKKRAAQEKALLNEIKAEQRRAVEIKAAELRLAELKAVHDKAIEMRKAELRAAELKAAEDKAAQDKAIEMMMAEMKAAELKAAQEKAAQEKEIKIRAAEIAAAQEKAAQEKTAEIRATKLKTEERIAAQKRVAEMKAAQKRAAQKKAAEMKALLSKLKAEKLKIAREKIARSEELYRKEKIRRANALAKEAKRKAKIFKKEKLLRDKQKKRLELRKARLEKISKKQEGLFKKKFVEMKRWTETQRKAVDKVAEIGGWKLKWKKKLQEDLARKGMEAKRKELVGKDNVRKAANVEQLSIKGNKRIKQERRGGDKLVKKVAGGNMKALEKKRKEDLSSYLIGSKKWMEKLGTDSETPSK